jgi:hypothetical protein
MHRGINAEKPSASTSFSSIKNVGRNVTTPALTHSPTIVVREGGYILISSLSATPTKISHDIKPNSPLTSKMIFEYGKFVVFIIARQSPKTDDEKANELFRLVKVVQFCGSLDDT